MTDLAGWAAQLDRAAQLLGDGLARVTAEAGQATGEAARGFASADIGGRVVRHIGGALDVSTAIESSHVALLRHVPAQLWRVAEDGVNPHAIYAHGRALRFDGIYRRHVHHPGTRPFHTLTETVEVEARTWPALAGDALLDVLEGAL